MPPQIIFIIPYRNRLQQKQFFINYIKIIMQDINDYEIYFSTQTDERPFNRGVTKNVGFLAMKQKYPNHYKNITFVFNDVDTLPYDKDIINYDTRQGIIKHFYGYTNALGGIVSITGHDFEHINGYPNYWAWGKEDNVIQQRALKNRIKIDRSNFYPIGHPNILQLFDGLARVINKKGIKVANEDTGSDGISSIRNLNFEIQQNEILIYSFETNVNHHDIQFQQYRLGENKSKQQKHNSFGLTNLLGRK